MQGTQYAPRESILCMEHFVALHGSYIFVQARGTLYRICVVILSEFGLHLHLR